ncbi:MAG: serine/threonine protein kinase, partial [Pseudanabaenaceae cyanobacterium bins.68]|nr:serine/threonine protein kinase [Pseudanabaenaceae cyanobacterium bins.68]
GLFAHFALAVNFGPFSYAIAAGLFLIVIWLRLIQILDNRDLLVFVNGISVLGILIAGWIWRFPALPPFGELMILALVAGCFGVALTAFGRLLYQVIYRLI